MATATVEIVKPRNAIDQNGRTSDLKLLRPRWPQTQCRASKYAGTALIITAVTLAIQPGQSSIEWKKKSNDCPKQRLNMDTPQYRNNLRKYCWTSRSTNSGSAGMSS